MLERYPELTEISFEAQNRTFDLGEDPHRRPGQGPTPTHARPTAASASRCTATEPSAPAAHTTCRGIRWWDERADRAARHRFSRGSPRAGSCLSVDGTRQLREIARSVYVRVRARDGNLEHQAGVATDGCCDAMVPGQLIDERPRAAQKQCRVSGPSVSCRGSGGLLVVEPGRSTVRRLDAARWQPRGRALEGQRDAPAAGRRAR